MTTDGTVGAASGTDGRHPANPAYPDCHACGQCEACCPVEPVGSTSGDVFVRLNADQQEALRALWDLMPYLDALAASWFDMLPDSLKEVLGRD